MIIHYKTHTIRRLPNGKFEAKRHSVFYSGLFATASDAIVYLDNYS